MNAAPSQLVTWVKATRAPFLSVSLLPALLAGAISMRETGFRKDVFWICVIGILLAHTAVDLLDDYLDFKTGHLGNKNKQFHDSPLLNGDLRPSQVLFATILSASLALLCGTYAAMVLGARVGWLVALGGFFGAFYTAPPFRLNFRGWGETALFFAFGPLLVGGIAWLFSPSGISQAAWTASVISGLLVMNIGVVSNLFDAKDDAAKDKRTLAVLLGAPRTRRLLVLTTSVSLGAIAVAVAFKIFPAGAIFSLIGILPLLAVFRHTRDENDLDLYEPAMRNAILGCCVVLAILAVTIFVG